jgi:hypothetical protein
MVGIQGDTMFRPSSLPFSVVCLALWACGCTPDPVDPEDFVPDDPDDPGDPLDSDEPGDSDAPGDTGEIEDTGPAPEPKRFALLEVVSTLVDDPTPWSDDSGATQLFAWKQVDMLRDGVEMRWTETVCGMESTEIFGTLTIYPDAFLDALPVVEKRATLSEAVTGASFVMEPHVTVLGAQLDDPWGDPMPQQASDPEQWDQDRDGQPGVTVRVEQSLLGEGEVYVGQRTFTSYQGVLLSAERIEGYVDSDNEQVVFDASSWWLEIDTNSRDDPEPSHSYFIFQQIDRSMGCAEILDQADALFE